MHFSKIALFSLIGFAVAAPLEVRTASQITSDINTVDSDVATFDSDIKSFSGSLLQCFIMLSAYDSLDSAVKTTTSDVKSTGTLNAGDSATVFMSVATMTSDFETFLSDATAKVSPLSTD
jgi:hypothetical protein